jgi:hypothetical protein
VCEPDRGFLSDNYLSNETSYLEVVPLLRSRPAGGVYIGVGPEQNFTYMAATRPVAGVHRRHSPRQSELKERSGRKYPALRELLVSRDADGNRSGFLGSEDSYRLVRKLQQENKVVPVVGDFSGEHALAAVAREMKRRGLSSTRFTFPTSSSSCSESAALGGAGWTT